MSFRPPAPGTLGPHRATLRFDTEAGASRPCLPGGAVRVAKHIESMRVHGCDIDGDDGDDLTGSDLGVIAASFPGVRFEGQKRLPPF